MADNSQSLIRRRPVFTSRNRVLHSRGSLFEVYMRASVPRVTEEGIARVTEDGHMRVVERRTH